MAIETSLRTLLLAQSSITALVPAQTVGGVSFSGIFLDHNAEGFVAPFVLLTMVDHDPLKRLDGTSNGLAFTDFDIDCYCSNRPAAIALAAAVNSFLKDYTGAADTDTIDAVLFQSMRDDVVFLGDGRDQRHYVRSLSYQIQHK